MCGSADPAMLSGPPLNSFERSCLRMVVEEHNRIVQEQSVYRTWAEMLPKKQVGGKFIVWPVRGGRSYVVGVDPGTSITIKRGEEQ